MNFYLLVFRAREEKRSVESDAGDSFRVDEQLIVRSAFTKLVPHEDHRTAAGAQYLSVAQGQEARRRHMPASQLLVQGNGFAIAQHARIVLYKLSSSGNKNAVVLCHNSQTRQSLFDAQTNRLLVPNVQQLDSFVIRAAPKQLLAFVPPVEVRNSVFVSLKVALNRAALKVNDARVVHQTAAQHQTLLHL